MKGKGSEVGKEKEKGSMDVRGRKKMKKKKVEEECREAKQN